MAFSFGEQLGEPDFVDDKGQEFRLCRCLTRYAVQKLGQEYRVLHVTAKEGVSYLICKGSEPVHESFQYDAVACAVDAIDLCNRFDEEIVD